MKEDLNQISYDVIYLAACALHDTAPDEDKVASMDLHKLYQVSRFHTMTAIVCMAIENTSAFEDASMELRKKWKDAKNKAIRKNIMLDSERLQLFAYMDKKGIWHMPLKGSVLKDLYPKIGMRQMADNDILFDAAYQYEVKDYMTSHGYEAVSVGKSNHDVYEKPPVYNFELHTSLFGAVHNHIWAEYYDDIKVRLLRDGEDSFGYHFTDEDFYVYLITHAYKHFKGSGTGLRTLLDVYVYRWVKGDTINWNYVNQETKKLGIDEFERKCHKMSYRLFDEPSHFLEVGLTLAEQEQLSYFSGSGTYGTIENRVKKEIEKLQSDGKPVTVKTKLKYYRNRLFPDADWMKTYYPVCYRHKWLTPFLLIFRLVRGVLFKRHKVSVELQALKQISEK